MANNYTVNTITTQPFSAGVNGLFDAPNSFPSSNGYKITITPNPGYTIEAKDFTINGSTSVSSSTQYSHTQSPSRWEHQTNLPPGIHKVVFEDTDNPNNSQGWIPTATNNIDVWIYFGDSPSTPYFPGTTGTIDIDIDGISRPIGPQYVGVEIKDLSLEETICELAQWPHDPGANPNLVSCGYLGSPNQSDGYHFIRSRNMHSNVQSSTTPMVPWPSYTYFASDALYNSATYSPSNPATARVRETLASQVLENGYTNIYSKFIYCGPGVAYIQAPSYLYNATDMPDINIIETPNNHQATATVVSLTGNPNPPVPMNSFRWIVDDASSIIPGMIVSGSSQLDSNISVYPFSFDVRVVDVNYFTNEIKLSHIQGPHTNFVNETLQFSADTADGSCVAKRFIIQSNPSLAIQAGANLTLIPGASDREISFYFETMDIAPSSALAATQFNITGFDI